MKTKLECPKCAGRRIWRIEQINERPDGAVMPHPTPLALSQEGSMSRGFHSVGHFEVFVCGECGFSEWYARGLSDLRADPNHGIHLIEGPER